jgi:uncharacterized protein HemX
MNLLAFIYQHSYQTVIGLILSLTLCGVVFVYQQQEDTNAALQQLLKQETKTEQSSSPDEQLHTLLKSIQASQAEIKTLLSKLSANKTESNKVPTSKMKRFKHGTFKPAKPTGY